MKTFILSALLAFVATAPALAQEPASDSEELGSMVADAGIGLQAYIG